MPRTLSELDEHWSRLSVLEGAGHVAMITAQSFPPGPLVDESGVRTALGARLDQIAAALHSGARLEVGLSAEPIVTADHPESLKVADVLRPHLESGRLTICLLKSGADITRMARLVADAGKAKRSLCFRPPLPAAPPYKQPSPVQHGKRRLERRNYCAKCASCWNRAEPRSYNARQESRSTTTRRARIAK